jgi:hypothetical protein
MTRGPVNRFALEYTVEDQETCLVGESPDDIDTFALGQMTELAGLGVFQFKVTQMRNDRPVSIRNVKVTGI